MQKIATAIPGVWILEPKVFTDYRGYFMETYNQSTFAQLDIHDSFVQDNVSRTLKKNTLRGIHFQNDPMAQCKIVRVTHGAVKDLAVDLRKGSPTYLRWIMVELSDENKRMLYIPRGFGHAFLTITEDVEFTYKVDHVYSWEHDRTIRFDDPQIGVDWGAQELILSEKDRIAPLLNDSDCNFIYQNGDAE